MQALNPFDELRTLFRGLIEQAFFSELGLCVPQVTDYLTDMLAEFVHVDQIYRLCTVDGGAIRDISAFHTETKLPPDASELTRVRVLHRYVGDFSLFWTGMHPESLRGRHQAGVDRMREYVLQGKRGYDIASDLSSDEDAPPGMLLRELSLHFEPCARGLMLVRQSWEQVGRPPRSN